MKPKWSEAYQSFELVSDRCIEIILYHKARIFGDTEIGRAKLLLKEIA
jgi:hypothetical protein